MNTDYDVGLENRVNELEEIVKRQGSLINQYKMIVKFEFRVEKNRITLSMNNGSCNHIFATAKRDDFNWNEWFVAYGDPFRNKFADEHMKKISLLTSDLYGMYDKLKNVNKFNEHHIMLLFLMQATNTDTIEYDLTVDNVRLY